ncbi:hypothetical protein V6N12_025008 [Hibiscus sabdariffa]|uniref:Uncharacterized protein n=1 Tax=Hibiscus sabdariffa TaxID=183260 RepID=A0ABR1ZXN7_9ROSI
MKEQKLSTETLQDVARQLALLADQLNRLIKTNEEIDRSGNLGNSRDTSFIYDSYVFDEVSEPMKNDIEDHKCIVKGKTQIMDFTDYEDQLQVSQLMEQTSNLRYANMIFGGNVEPIQGNLTGTLNLNLASRKILNSHVPVIGTDMSEKMMGIDLIIGVKVLNFAEGAHAVRGTFGPSQVHDTNGEEIQNDATTMQATSSISRAFEEFNPCIVLIVGQHKEFEGKKLVPTTKEGSKLVKSEDEKQKNEALKEKFEAIMQHPGNELEGDVLRTLKALVARGVIGARRRVLEGDFFLEGGMSYFEMQGLFEKVKLQRTIRD